MSVKVLIVEDELIIAANLAMQIESYGYQVVETIPRVEEVLPFIKENPADIILLDINLKGDLDGIELAQIIKSEHGTPIIFVTANNDDHHFDRAKAVSPYGFISKPVKKVELQRILSLAVLRIEEEQKTATQIPVKEEKPVVLNDCIFVRSHGKMIRVMLDDVLYIEADRNYSKITTSQKEYLLVTTLKDLEEKLGNNAFLRTHRSFIVHLKHIDEIATSHVMVKSKIIPITADSRKQLMQYIHKV
jgi:DNA-binding LytR/AlgR family response regulator